VEKSIILITGGSQGIGASTFCMAAEKGYHVIINYAYNTEAAISVVEKIRMNGGSAEAHKADISNENEVAGMLESISTPLLNQSLFIYSSLLNPGASTRRCPHSSNHPSAVGTKYR
jgi:NAD(P)-dependent dehydrogenase (short-subunit alcohol dehydrogenase family)